jgi:hypothetical protein
MPQEIGQNFKSVIPTLADDASIEEAFFMYHYGDQNWSLGQPIPSNSIEGQFSSLQSRIVANENAITNLSNTYVATAPSSTQQNLIQATSIVHVPLTIRGAVGQTASLQEWVVDTGSSLITKARISANGSFATLGYISVGSINISTSVANIVQVSSPTHKGIVVRAAGSQTENLQEWQDNSGNVLLSVDSGGSFVYQTPVELLTSFSNVITNTNQGKFLILSNSTSNISLNIQLNSSLPIPVGAEFNFIKYGTGEVSFTVSSGVVLNSENNYRSIDGQYSAASLIKVGSDEWILLGALKS